MFNLYQYSLPFRRPFKTAKGTFKDRQGLILRFRSRGADGFSEAAPLPGFSSETLKDVILSLTNNRKSIQTFFEKDFSLDDLSRFTKTLANLPSLQFAVSSLGISLISERKKMSLAAILKREPPPPSISVNAVLGDLSPDIFMKEAVRTIESGFSVLKCKVTQNPGHLPGSLREISAAYPEVLFRLDANQSWPHDRVNELSGQFADLPIQYIEEPVESASIREFEKMAGRCALPVAADESVVKFGLSRWMESGYQPSCLIIKPTLLGNLAELSATIGPRDHPERRIIFTSTLESAAGRNVIASYAGLFGSPEDAHGLNTGHLFTEDLFQPSEPIQKNSKMSIKTGETITFDEIDHTKLNPIF